MPYTPDQARQQNHHIKNDTEARQWVDVYNSEMAKHGDEGRAHRAANGVIMQRQHRGGVRAAADDRDITDD